MRLGREGDWTWDMKRLVGLRKGIRFNRKGARQGFGAGRQRGQSLVGPPAAGAASCSEARVKQGRPPAQTTASPATAVPVAGLLLAGVAAEVAGLEMGSARRGRLRGAALRCATSQRSAGRREQGMAGSRVSMWSAGGGATGRTTRAGGMLHRWQAHTPPAHMPAAFNCSRPPAAIKCRRRAGIPGPQNPGASRLPSHLALELVAHVLQAAGVQRGVKPCRRPCHHAALL